MSKLSTINPLSLIVGALFLISLAGFRVSAAAELATDPQVLAAQVLQQPQTWIASSEGFKKSGHGSDKVLDSQQQAQRVLQPVNDGIARSSSSGQSVEPQLQAVRLLNHSFY